MIELTLWFLAGLFFGMAIEQDILAPRRHIKPGVTNTFTINGEVDARSQEQIRAALTSPKRTK